MREELLAHFRVAELPGHPVGEVVMDIDEVEHQDRRRLVRLHSQEVCHDAHGGARHRQNDQETRRQEPGAVQSHVPGGPGGRGSAGPVELNASREFEVLQRVGQLDEEEGR